MASENVFKIRKFYHEFFNEGRQEAYDELAHPDYMHNGVAKGDGGAGLKKWLESKLAELDINVVIVDEIDNGDIVGIRWATNSIVKKTGERIDPKYGINLYQFKDGRVLHNWQCKSN